MNNSDEQAQAKLYAGVLKKAVGYEAVETQDEYALQDGEMVLVRRKVTTKDVPPDLAAIKLLLDGDDGEPTDYAALEEERKALTEAFFAHLKTEIPIQVKEEEDGTDRHQVQDPLRNGGVQKPGHKND